MDEESAQVFLPSRERCFERHRLARFGETVTCVHCGSEEVVKRGTMGKDAAVLVQKLRNVLQRPHRQHRFKLEEIFYIVKEMRSELIMNTKSFVS